MIEQDKREIAHRMVSDVIHMLTIAPLMWVFLFAGCAMFGAVAGEMLERRRVWRAIAWGVGGIVALTLAGCIAPR